MKTTIKSIYRETEKYLDKEVILEGWIRTSRTSKTIGFIELNDGTFFKNLQIVFEESLDNFKEIGDLALSSAIKVRGKLIETPESKQPFEVKATQVEIEGARWFGKLSTCVYYGTMILIVFFPTMPEWIIVGFLSLATICALVAAILYIPDFLDYKREAKAEI